jgi:hypothetical protein
VKLGSDTEVVLPGTIPVRLECAGGIFQRLFRYFGTTVPKYPKGEQNL